MGLESAGGGGVDCYLVVMKGSDRLRQSEYDTFPYRDPVQLWFVLDEFLSEDRIASGSPSLWVLPRLPEKTGLAGTEPAR